MTIGKRNCLDRRFRAMAIIGRFVRNNLSRRLGIAIMDITHDLWDRSYT